MMLYLIVIQTLALFSSHLIASHKIASSVLTIVLMMIVNLSVGGYVIHPGDVPDFIKWLIYLSPQKWLLPVLTKDEYSDETLANAGGLQLCRNKQVKSIVVSPIDVIG
jgi:ABC-2 type transporter